ncbi:MAG: DUF402 domain-containing protein [Pyrinomonadaceae bacterium]
MEESNLPIEVIVQVRKMYGGQHRTWSGWLVEREGSLLVLDAKFQNEVNHDVIGNIPFGTVSREFYWLDRHYNIFRFSSAAGVLQSYYCNVCLPPSLQGHLLTYIDLDIDVLVKPDYAYEILDMEEFNYNVRQYSYPADIEQKAHEGLEELTRLIENRSFPFLD